MENRIVAPDIKKEDESIEKNLRPQSLDEYIGQKSATDNLKIFIEAAKLRKEPLDHVLFYGPPGLGKTTLAGIIARELGVDIRITSGPAIERSGDLAAILTNLEENDVLFIDEIHRLNRSVEEVLYSAMEDYALDIMIGKGPSARSIRLDLAKFTLIGATTRAESLSAPLRDRFGVLSKFELYAPEEIGHIIRRSANILEIEIDEQSVDEISKRARGTPRVANRILKRVRDFAQVMGAGHITLKDTVNAMEMLSIDEMGLESLDIDILNTIIDRFNGGPVGIDTISAAVGEERITIEDAYEPYLIQIGFLNRTPKGRVVSEKAYKHLGIVYDKEEQISL